MSGTLEVRAAIAAEEGLRELRRKLANHKGAAHGWRMALVTNSVSTPAEIAHARRMRDREGAIVDLATAALEDLPANPRERLYHVTNALQVIASLEEDLQT